MLTSRPICHVTTCKEPLCKETGSCNFQLLPNHLQRLVDLEGQVLELQGKRVAPPPVVLPPEPGEGANPWRQAIDDELASIESTVGSYATPRAALRALIDWHVQVALDPKVSSDAEALVARGRAETELPREMLEYFAILLKHDVDRDRLGMGTGPQSVKYRGWLKALARCLASLSSPPANPERPAPAPERLGGWLCLLCGSGRPGVHGTLSDGRTPCPEAKERP